MAAPRVHVHAGIVVWYGGSARRPLDVWFHPALGDSAWLGQTWRSCPFSIAFLALPPLMLLLLALRRLAPTQLTIAGFAAGILSGGLAATAYALHCPEKSASFVATWYAAGILLCGVIGAIAGRRVLRW